MGLLLTRIALIILYIIGIPVLLISTIISLIQHKGDRYYKNIAKGIDIFGNVLCSPLFNIILIAKGSKHKFGEWGETISSVLGKNERDKELLKLGRVIANVLNYIDKEHCKNSIKD